MSALRRQNKLEPPLDDAEIYSNYIIAVANGIAKVMAKMGISTLHSYKVSASLNDDDDDDDGGGGGRVQQYHDIIGNTVCDLTVCVWCVYRLYSDDC